MEVAPDDGVDEYAGVFFGVAGRHVDDVGLDDDGSVAAGGRVEGGDGVVVAKPMIATYDTETKNMPLLVEDIQPLGAATSREARNHADLTEGADVALAHYHVAGLDKVFVDLRLVEASDDRPDGGKRGRDWLDDG